MGLGVSIIHLLIMALRFDHTGGGEARRAMPRIARVASCSVNEP